MEHVLARTVKLDYLIIGRGIVVNHTNDATTIMISIVLIRLSRLLVEANAESRRNLRSSLNPFDRSLLLRSRSEHHERNQNANKAATTHNRD